MRSEKKFDKLPIPYFVKKKKHLPPPKKKKKRITIQKRKRKTNKHIRKLLQRFFELNEFSLLFLSLRTIAFQRRNV